MDETGKMGVHIIIGEPATLFNFTYKLKNTKSY